MTEQERANFCLIALRYLLAGDFMESEEALSIIDERIKAIAWESESFKADCAAMRSTIELGPLAANDQLAHIEALNAFVADALSESKEQIAKMLLSFGKLKDLTDYYRTSLVSVLTYLEALIDLHEGALDRLKSLGADPEEFRRGEFPELGPAPP